MVTVMATVTVRFCVRNRIRVQVGVGVRARVTVTVRFCVRNMVRVQVRVRISVPWYFRNIKWLY